MAGERAFPGLGISGFYTDGSNGWADTLSPDLRMLSALVQPRAKSRVTALPGTPTAGDIYIVPSGAASNPNEIAIWDNSTWVYFVPTEGYTMYVIDEDRFVTFLGTSWVEAYMLYDIGFFLADVMTDLELVAKFIAVRKFTIPAGAPGSKANAEVASTGDVSMSLKKNGTEFGTVRFNISATGAFSAASATSFAAGDILTVVAPATADATLADVALTLKGVLSE